MPWTPRQVGDRVTYSSAATAQYKSAWRRWNAGKDLYGSLSFQGGDLSMLRFPSRRSPIGYWETAVLLGHSGGLGAGGGACPLPIDAAGFQFVRVINYVKEGYSYYREQRVPMDSPDDVYLAEGPTRISDPEGPWWPLYADDIITLEPNGFPPINQQLVTDQGSVLDGVVIACVVSSSGKKAIAIKRAGVRPFGREYDAISVNPGRLVYPGQYLYNSFQADFVDNYKIDHRVTETTSFELEFRDVNGRVVVPIGSACGVAPSGGNGNTPCSGSSGACTCPDFTRSHGIIPGSTFASERRFRDWTSSNAGALSAEPPKWCKHIWSTVIQYCAGGNAAAVEPSRNRAYVRLPRETRYGAESSDHLPFREWQTQRVADRRARRVQQRQADHGEWMITQQRWDSYNMLDESNQGRIRLHQRQLLRSAGSDTAFEREYERMIESGYLYPNVIRSEYRGEI